MVNTQFAQFAKTNQAMLHQQIQQTSDLLKQGFEYTENNRSYTLLGDIDSYYYLFRQARNIVITGTVCDTVQDGKCMDSLMLAPVGTTTFASMHAYGIVYAFYFFHFFDSTINLMQAAFLLPIILAIICVIAAFFIGRRLMNNVSGFFAAMIIALSPVILQRSFGMGMIFGILCFH